MTRRTAIQETADLHEGSEFELATGLNDTATVKIAGMFKSHLSMPIVMNQVRYESQFEKAYAPNTFFEQLYGADPDTQKGTPLFADFTCSIE